MDQDIKSIFEKLKSEYGQVASWAIWKQAISEDKSASNMGVEGLFDSTKNPLLFSQLRTDVVMVGYNFSIPTDTFPVFHNFHSCEGIEVHHATVRNASKLRYAFNKTPYWGAYMTDIIKNYVEAKSENVELGSAELVEHFRVFRDELAILKAEKPLIIAFGGKVYTLLKKHLRQEEYSRLVRVTHYAHYGSGCATHEGYRSAVLGQLAQSTAAQELRVP
jgi:hypothetical protein